MDAHARMDGSELLVDLRVVGFVSSGNALVAAQQAVLQKAAKLGVVGARVDALQARRIIKPDVVE